MDQAPLLPILIVINSEVELEYIYIQRGCLISNKLINLSLQTCSAIQ